MQRSHEAASDTVAVPDVTTTPRRGAVKRLAVAATASAIAAASFAGPALAAHTLHTDRAKTHAAQATTYDFTTIDNPGDPTFNQLLGINSSGDIVGYFGSGAVNHPNEAYQIDAPYTKFTPANYPASVQTQVTGINNAGATVGFWSGTNGGTGQDANYGFYTLDGRTVSVVYPTTNYGTPAVDQLLGINDHDVAAGFYTDANGDNHGYTYNILTGKFHDVTVTGQASVTATAIDDLGDVAGYYADSSTGTTDGFLQTKLGRTISIEYPGAFLTEPLGVNEHREVVGEIQMTSTSSTEGFVWTPAGGFQLLNDPAGVDGTVLNGVNDAGQIVGFYTDGATNLDGLLANPSPAS